MPARPADLVGFYIPRSDETHYTGQVVDRFSGKKSTPPSMTKQEFVAECDINNIIREYLVTGQIQHIGARAQAGAFLDLPDSMDFQESLAVQASANAAFAQLPSQVRERFANDPIKFLEFFEDPGNKEEATKLGFFETPPAPPRPVEVIIKAPDKAPGTDASPLVPPVPPKA